MTAATVAGPWYAQRPCGETGSIKSWLAVTPHPPKNTFFPPYTLKTPLLLLILYP